MRGLTLFLELFIGLAFAVVRIRDTSSVRYAALLPLSISTTPCDVFINTALKPAVPMYQLLSANAKGVTGCGQLSSVS
jgi:hypothetical protein